jgi:hypothetical protein
MNKADDILKLAHAYAIKGEYEPFRAAVESLAADAARTDELKWVVNLLNEYGLQALDVVLTFKTVALSAPAPTDPRIFNVFWCVEWLKSHHQDYANIDDLCNAMLCAIAAALPQPQEPQK